MQLVVMTENQIARSQSILLDLIRYFLAAIVVVGHGFGFFLGYFDGFFPRVFPHPQSIAVVCFFYLSGFLIVGSQIRQGDSSEGCLSKYLFDRITRVYITLVPSLIFVAAVDFLMRKFYNVNVDLVVNYTGSSILFDNLLLIPSVPYGTMRPIWSLMYEWWIYLIFGGVYFLKSNKFLALLLIFVGGYYTLKVNAAGEAGHIWIIWAFGGWCAYLQKKIPWASLNSHLLNFLALLSLVVAGWIYFNSKNAFNLPAGIFVAIFIFIFTSKKSLFLKPLLPLKAAAKSGANLSFTLFLTHYTALTYTKEFLALDGWIGLIIGFLISSVIAFSIAFLTEYKLLRIKNCLSRLGQSLAVRLR